MFTVIAATTQIGDKPDYILLDHRGAGRIVLTLTTSYCVMGGPLGGKSSAIIEISHTVIYIRIT